MARGEKIQALAGYKFGEFEDHIECIGRFGLEGYFARSRKMLTELKSARTAETET